MNQKLCIQDHLQKSVTIYLFLNFFQFYLFIFFTILYWFCHTLTLIAMGVHVFPILNPPPSPSHPLGHPCAPAQRIYLLKSSSIIVYCLFSVVSCGFIPLEVLVAQFCPTLCDPTDCSSPGSSIHGFLQARILEQVATSYSRESS